MLASRSLKTLWSITPVASTSTSRTCVGRRAEGLRMYANYRFNTKKKSKPKSDPPSQTQSSFSPLDIPPLSPWGLTPPTNSPSTRPSRRRRHSKSKFKEDPATQKAREFSEHISESEAAIMRFEREEFPHVERRRLEEEREKVREEEEKERMDPEAFRRKLEEVRRWLDGKREKERWRVTKGRSRWEAQGDGGAGGGGGSRSADESRTWSGNVTRTGSVRDREQKKNVYGVRSSGVGGGNDHVSRETGHGHGQTRHHEASRVAASAVLGRRRVRVAGDL